MSKSETSTTSNNEALRQLMERHGLKQEHVATLTGYSVETVKGWFASPESTRYRTVRKPVLESVRRAIELGEHYTLEGVKIPKPKS